MNGIGVLVKKIKKRLPEFAVILMCMVILGVGVSRKEGYHMDELLSFQLSNAEYNPWIVPTQPEGRLAKFIHNEIDGENAAETLGNLADTFLDVLQNKGESKLLSYQADVYEEPVWISSEVFRDYVAVDKDDDFNYLSVYFNVKDDNHPPIHFMLLHTMSSLFKGAVYPFMGCVINMAAVAVTMVFMMKIGIVLAEILFNGKGGRMLGIFSAFLYGASAGALASVLLIRMYGVLTMFCVILLYLHVKKWADGSMKAEDYDKKRGFAGSNLALIVVTVLGFWTQYFFLFYCMIMAAVTVTLLLWQKRGKEAVVYIRSMVLAAVIGLGCFPFAISDVFASERGVEALGNLSSGLNGYGTRLAAFWNILGKRTFGIGLYGVAAAVIIGMAVAVRKEKRAEADRRNRIRGCLWLLVAPAVGYFLLAAKMSPYLVDRYIMPLFPLAALLGMVGVMCLAYCAEGVRTRKWLMSLLCVAVAVLQLSGLSHYDGSYLYTGYKEQLAFAQEYAEYPCICVYDGVGYYENLLEFAQYEETLLVKEAELAERKDIASVREHDSLVVLVKEEVSVENVCRILKEKYGFVPVKEILENSVYGDKMLLFSSIN